MVVVALANYQVDQGSNEPIEFVFDEQGKEDVAVRSMWAALKVLPPAQSRIVVNEPVFRSDKDTSPLQAADMTAWLFRRSVEATVTGKIAKYSAFQSAADVLDSIPQHLAILGNDDFQELLVRFRPIIDEMPRAPK